MINKDAIEQIKNIIDAESICDEMTKSRMYHIEALELAIKALENVEIMKKYLKPCFDCKFRPDKVGHDYNCANCFKYDSYEKEEQS